ncbi:hypothetical protein LV28_00065 [Pandoraea pnomenusa]|uniref:Right handed beta helix domain-containing protein n=1 Tax=Pandoraea pnomenusa TaxID=93220 RepID=A0A378YXZ1_9BURK|nr:hypothetical protein [Pandoraea pnomenusa]AIU25170.1 hypothetical protein LV28_00065 [Pandoraea pnomenusa]SUA73863.1 Uncharacterised protein [Pandoraea pnomenusa]SUA82025.1 Uncharacterised protein [Pandoraea pnomenusa]
MAIDIGGGSDIEISGNVFKGYDVAIRVSDASNVSVTDSEFINVGTALKAKRIRNLVARDNVSSTLFQPRLTKIAYLIRKIIEGRT